jgi:hypothetical protein
MGANPTQAIAIVLFFVAFLAIATGLAAGGNLIAFIVGAALLAASAALFLKAKPWEHQED